MASPYSVSLWKAMAASLERIFQCPVKYGFLFEFLNSRYIKPINHGWVRERTHEVGKQKLHQGERSNTHNRAARRATLSGCGDASAALLLKNLVSLLMSDWEFSSASSLSLLWDSLMSWRASLGMQLFFGEDHMWPHTQAHLKKIICHKRCVSKTYGCHRVHKFNHYVG